MRFSPFILEDCSLFWITLWLYNETVCLSIPNFKKNLKNINIIYFMNKIIARALSRTRGHTSTHAQVRTHIRALAHANACLHTHAYTHKHSRMHTLAHALPHAHANACLHTLAYTHTPMRVCTCLHIHSHMHEPTRTHPCVGFFIAWHMEGLHDRKTSFTCPCVLLNLKKYFVLQSRFLLIVGETCNNFYYFVKILKISKVNWHWVWFYNKIVCE